MNKMPNDNITLEIQDGKGKAWKILMSEQFKTD
jgi:hypothetical protein